MKTEQKTGIWLIIGSIGVIVPYTLLTVNFNYPQVLRLPAAGILKSFLLGGDGLIYSWLFFALGGLPLFWAYRGIAQVLQQKQVTSQLLTFFGLSSLVFQMVGLLRWVFVVPILAQSYAASESVAEKEAIIVAFKVINQFGGVLLGEHLGQLFTLVWTVGIAFLLVKAQIIKPWLGWFAYAASFIYALAQAELLQTVIPAFPVFDLAGFIGSTLWLIWLVILGITLLRKDKVQA